MRDRFAELDTFVGFTEDDGAALLALRPHLESVAEPLVDEFYRRILGHPTTRSVLLDHGDSLKLRPQLVRWLESLLTGPWDHDFFERRRAIGRRHVEVGLPQRFVPLAMHHIRDGLRELVERVHEDDTAQRRVSLRAVDRILDLELSVLIDSYVDHHADQLRRSERLATLGHLAASVSHELRNPLGVVNTSVLLARRASSEKPPDRDAMVRHLGRIARASEQASRMATQLLTLARPQPAHKLLSPVAQVVDDALRMVGTELDSITIEVQIDPPDAKAELDAELISRALANLLRNSVEAIHSTGEPGHIVVVGQRDARGGLELHVRDNGSGLSDEQLQRASEPWFTTRTRGTGLGLAIVEEIADAHAGCLILSNRTDTHGALATLKLPRVSNATKRATSSNSRLSDSHSSRDGKPQGDRGPTEVR